MSFHYCHCWLALTIPSVTNVKNPTPSPNLNPTLSPTLAPSVYYTAAPYSDYTPDPTFLEPIENTMTPTWDEGEWLDWDDDQFNRKKN
jgi:hypothetical protein